MKTYEVTYLDTENRVYGIDVEAEDEDEAREKATDQANESYHGLKQILSVN